MLALSGYLRYTHWMIRVVCGVFIQGDEVFLARRKPGLRQEGLWEFPGGKIEDAETEESCLNREIFEELGSSIQIKHRLAVSKSYDNGQSLFMTAYLCKFDVNPQASTDHDIIEWVHWEDLKKYNMPKLDMPIAKRVMHYFQHEACES